MDEMDGLLGEVAGRKIWEAMALHDAELLEQMGRLVKDTFDKLAKGLRDGVKPKEGG